LKDRPDYERFLALNQQNIERKRQVYLAGRRDASASGPLKPALISAGARRQPGAPPGLCLGSHRAEPKVLFRDRRRRPGGTGLITFFHRFCRGRKTQREQINKA